MRVARAATPPFFKNGFLLTCERTRESVLIDPGDEVGELLVSAQAARAVVTNILLTHAHLDHISGVKHAKTVLDAPVWLHPDDLFLYEGLVEQGRMFGIALDPAPPVDAFYDLQRPLTFGEYVVEIRHTPGHCPGGVCLAVGREGSVGRELFVGDTLFAGSIGRTDLPGGNHPVLIRSIRDVLFAYPDDTIVHPGHGPDTTIGTERRTNPFLT